MQYNIIYNKTDDTYELYKREKDGQKWERTGNTFLFRDEAIAYLKTLEVKRKDIRT